MSSIAPDILVGFTFPEQAGMRHEFEELGKRHRDFHAQKADPRLRPGWTTPGVDPADPLGIVRSSHHTILTPDLARASRLSVDAAGGRIIGKQRNHEPDASTTFMQLGDAVVEFAVPDADTMHEKRVSEGNDHYLGISLEVANLDNVSAHLSSVGLTPRRPDRDVVTIDPDDAFGMQWRFIRTLPYKQSGRTRAGQLLPVARRIWCLSRFNRGPSPRFPH
ncbi:MAG: hypothetical protein EOO27_47650 [Comamonadaceae bacterium]|nr:MAG: hypothetical protein EOO27_47650 [Comamonadaceae bacterium]